VAKRLEPSPFKSEYHERAFLEAFQLCVETDDPQEEEWAYSLLVKNHAAHFGDGGPSLLDVMKWAAFRPVQPI
jgi:hypothetical protein